VHPPSPLPTSRGASVPEFRRETTAPADAQFGWSAGPGQPGHGASVPGSPWGQRRRSRKAR